MGGNMAALSPQKLQSRKQPKTSPPALSIAATYKNPWNFLSHPRPLGHLSPQQLTKAQE